MEMRKNIKEDIKQINTDVKKKKIDDKKQLEDNFDHEEIPSGTILCNCFTCNSPVCSPMNCKDLNNEGSLLSQDALTAYKQKVREK